jgi:carboxyl-terminal processing protease
MIAKRGLIVGATALLTATVAVTGAGIHLSKSLAGFRESPKQLVDEVWQVVNQEYVDGTFNGNNWRAIRSQYLKADYQTQEEAYKAIREMLEKLNDPYTRFMDPEEFKSLQIDTSGELTGVGIQIAQDEETKAIKVISPIEGSPAAKAGLLAEDVITQIDGKSTNGMDINQAVSLIRGPVNSQVVLNVSRSGRPLTFTLTRALIELHPVRYSLKQSPTGPIGYVRLTQFSSNASAEMRKAIRDLNQQNVTGYILDLRSNPGGLLYASAEIARMWLPKGDIVSTVDRKGVTDRLQAGRGVLTDKPLVVLIDNGSASASEILAGALQDNRRATLVGAKTFGKGLVQSVNPLGDGSGLAVTIAKYFTPSGRDINKKGIEPDIELKLSEQQREALAKDNTQIGTTADPQYLKALDVLNQQIRAQGGKKQAQSKPVASPK